MNESTNGQNGETAKTAAPAYSVVSVAVLATCSDGHLRLVQLTRVEQKEFFRKLRHVTGRRIHLHSRPLKLVFAPAQPKRNFFSRLFRSRAGARS